MIRQTMFFVAVCGLTVNGALGQAELRAGKEGTGKPYTISVGLRQEYDDNINTSSSNESGSFKTVINPGIAFNYPMENTLFSASYNFGATYFWDRPGDDWDFSHLFVARINHKFSPRFEIDIREQFWLAQDAQVRQGVAIQRRLGDGYVNIASVQGTYKWAERFSTSTTYTNTISVYDDQAIADTNDYIQHEVSQDFLFNILPTTNGVVNYAFTTTGYDVIDRDSDVHRFTVGADHYLLPTWLLTGRVGAEVQLYDNEDLEDGTSPYGNLATVWNFLPNSSARFGYTYGTNLTDDPNFGSSEGHTFDVSLTHGFTQKLSAGVRASYALQTFSQREALTAVSQDIDEGTLSAEVFASYAFTEYFSVDAGYRHTFVDSDNLLREYTRNQVWLGITGKY